jgi:hypothetical protein
MASVFFAGFVVTPAPDQGLATAPAQASVARAVATCAGLWLAVIVWPSAAAPHVLDHQTYTQAASTASTSAVSGTSKHV